MAADLTPEEREFMLGLRATMDRECRCESYFSFVCDRCRRLSKQGGGDALLGEAVTRQALEQLGLIGSTETPMPPDTKPPSAEATATARAFLRTPIHHPEVLARALDAFAAQAVAAAVAAERERCDRIVLSVKNAEMAAFMWITEMIRTGRQP